MGRRCRGPRARRAVRYGETIASELRAHGVDFSFAPVLDLDYAASAVIGNRAFHADPVIVADLAGALLRGMNAGGCAGVGKHFPGHGCVSADSHVDTPVDARPLDTILRTDIVPYAALIAQGLDAVMPAHVVYPAVDVRPAGFSRDLDRRDPARPARLRRSRDFRRPRHGGRAIGRRHRRARRRGARRRMRHRARLQRLRGDGRSAGALVTGGAAGARAPRRANGRPCGRRRPLATVTRGRRVRIGDYGSVIAAVCPPP